MRVMRLRVFFDPTVTTYREALALCCNVPSTRLAVKSCWKAMALVASRNDMASCGCVCAFPTCTYNGRYCSRHCTPIEA